MFHDCVVGVYESFDKAQDAIRSLEKAHFPANQVSLVTHNVRSETPQKSTMQYGDETERRATAGAGIGGLVGLLLGAPLLAIPGLGPVLVAGPIAAGMTGAIVGGFLGSMGGWGVHTDHVRQYENRVRSGSLLVVASGNPLQVAEAKRVLDMTDAEDVRQHSETSNDSVDP